MCDTGRATRSNNKQQRHTTTTHNDQATNLQQLRHTLLHARALHEALHFVQHHPQQFLDVVLLEGLVGIPPEAGGEFFSGHGVLRLLHLQKQVLQRPNAVAAPGVFEATRGSGDGHLKHDFPEQAGVEQGLQQRVHVTRGALIPDAHHAHFVPLERQRRVQRRTKDPEHVHFRGQAHGVVGWVDVALRFQL